MKQTNTDETLNHLALYRLYRRTTLQLDHTTTQSQSREREEGGREGGGKRNLSFDAVVSDALSAVGNITHTHTLRYRSHSHF